MVPSWSPRDEVTPDGVVQVVVRFHPDYMPTSLGPVEALALGQRTFHRASKLRADMQDVADAEHYAEQREGQ